MTTSRKVKILPMTPTTFIYRRFSMPIKKQHFESMAMSDINGEFYLNRDVKIYFVILY